VTKQWGQVSLGIELNEDYIKTLLDNPKEDFLAPTDQWDKEFRINDRLWSKYPDAPSRYSEPYPV
jgi:hypothetical protein